MGGSLQFAMLSMLVYQRDPAPQNESSGGSPHDSFWKIQSKSSVTIDPVDQIQSIQSAKFLSINT